MITINLHRVALAAANEHADFSTAQVVDEDGSYVSIFLRGADHAARAASIADAINAAISAQIADAGEAA